MCLKMYNKFNNSKNEFLFILLFIKNNFFTNSFFFVKDKNLFSFFNFSNFYKYIFHTSFWLKIRISYYVNNWIYTTNHKRIAVNYFWFVILSGIVGMVLATLIRLEFAYPGVGVFAGDSLQYLSMATAHGVIMVFFMIMPLLLGAFANFLIPTQLGVHDVAFPRLNSAAFWFLPGGLLMLCQLVCTDRRYQRMNCFNIREIESILKRKFFTDLINTHDHRILLDKTAMGLRFKTSNINAMNSNIFNFYNYGLEFSPKIRVFNEYIFYKNESFFSFSFFNLYLQSLIDFFTNNNFSIINILNNLFITNYYTLYSLNLTFNFKHFFLNLINFFSSIALIAFRYTEITYDQILHTSTFILNFYPALVQGINNLKCAWDVIFLTLFNLIIIEQPFMKIFWSFYDLLVSFLYNSFYIFSFHVNSYPISLFTINIFQTITDFFFINFLLESSNLINSVNFSFFSAYNFLNDFYFFFNNFFYMNQTPSSFKITPLLNNNNFALNNIFFIQNNPYSTYQSSSVKFTNLDYNSYFIYAYTFYSTVCSLPYFFISIFNNFFNLNGTISILNYTYTYLFSFYFPSLLGDNALFYFYQKLTYNFFASEPYFFFSHFLL